MRILSILSAAILASFCVNPAAAKTICTVVMDAPTGKVLIEEGDCHSPVTPASTFKVPLAAMGYDSGILKDADHPVFEFRDGDPDWGGKNWTGKVNPTSWLRYSVVWYSRRITHQLGADALTKYAKVLGYGNADFSGDIGFNNGLERAWIASSLKISPHGQIQFLRDLVSNALPVSKQAMKNTRQILERNEVSGWTIFGKTGSAYPRRADRSFDYARGWGWYVGWAQKGETTLVFARLTQASERRKGSPGNLTRDAFFAEWSDLVNQ